MLLKVLDSQVKFAKKYEREQFIWQHLGGWVYRLLQQGVTSAISIWGLYAAPSLSEGQHTMCYRLHFHVIVVLLFTWSLGFWADFWLLFKKAMTSPQLHFNQITFAQRWIFLQKILILHNRKLIRHQMKLDRQLDIFTAAFAIKSLIISDLEINLLSNIACHWPDKDALLKGIIKWDKQTHKLILGYRYSKIFLLKSLSW